MVGSGSNEEEGKRALDATVGGLVWVRRRNGCWWPGQIVGLDELSENGDGSPRSGTPIKLLGRDDSSVDWYDLETTKAVKAFRCGEYDSCIEKAKLTAAKFLKRSLKYPRREIAIYYALEIEKSKGASPDDKPGIENHADCENGSLPTKDSESSFEGTSSENTASACEENSSSTQDFSHSGISYEGTNGFACLKKKKSKGKRRKTPNDSEDDGNEGFKRMKGLNDLGVGSESEVKRIHVLALTNSAPQNSIAVNGTHSSNSKALANGGGVPTFKKKRSQVVHIHELLNRNYHRRPMTKVLENTTMVPVRIICDENANPFERSDVISSLCESEDGDKGKDYEHLNKQLPEVDSSDALIDVPFSDEELPLSDFSSVWQPSLTLKACVGALKGKSNRIIHIQSPSLELKSLDEPEPSPSYRTNNGSLKVEKSASKWQSKGIRKARFISKTDETISSLRKSDASHEKDVYATSLENPTQFSPSSNGLLNGFTDLRKHMSASTSSPRSFSYHPPHLMVHSSLDLPDVPSLYEVEVTVEATRHQAQHVPYISLMSKLSGKPITGHPLPIEPLKDGFCDLQISEYHASASCELVNEDVELETLNDLKVCKTKSIKLRSHSSRRKGKSSRRKVKSSRRKGRGVSAKSKKRRGSSSKKTRKLSSLTGLQKLSAGKGKSVMESSNGPTLACVPLKIVFSRINEALNGSTRSAHRAVTL